jgi:hypothetical protein
MANPRVSEKPVSSAACRKQHRTYVGSIERAERNVSLDNIEKLARALKERPHVLPTHER